MSISERISPLIGRMIIAWFFLSEAWSRLSHFDTSVSLLYAQHVPAAPAVLVVTLAAMFLGGASLALGFQARHGAVLLFGLTVVTSFLLHAYWTIDDPAARAREYDVFIRDMAIAGGLLVLVGIGSGPLSADNVGKKKK